MAEEYTTLPHENLLWYQANEPATGTTVTTEPNGNANRPLKQLLDNDKNLRDRLNLEHDAEGHHTALVIKEHLTESDGIINDNVQSDAGIQESKLALDLTNVVDYQGNNYSSTAELAEQVTKNTTTLTQINSVFATSAHTANSVRSRIPSCFDYASFNRLQEADFNAESLRDSSRWRLAVQAPLDSVRSADMANKLAILGNPRNLYINGYKVHLDMSPELLTSVLIDLGEAPSTGTRLDYVFIEFWKEKVIFGNEHSVLFPNGAVHFTPKDMTEFDNCTLYNDNSDDPDAPAYLAESDGHGYYVKGNDDHISDFISDPANNVVLETDGSFCQYRWRVRVVNGVSKYSMIMPHEDSMIKAQGALADESAIIYQAISDDVGASVASSPALSFDGLVHAIPLCIVHRRNQTAWSVANMNGADSYSVLSTGTTRPDNKFFDSIHIDDVVDLRQHGMFDNNFNFKRMSDINQDDILRGDHNTVFEHLVKNPDGNEEFADTGIVGTKLLRADCLIGAVPADSSWEVTTKLLGINGITSKLDGIRNYFSNMSGSQEIVGYLPSITSDNSMIPQPVFSYNASAHTIQIDASDLDSGNQGENYGKSNRTKLDSTTPSMRFSGSTSVLGLRDKNVAGSWVGLGTDSATFTFGTESHAVIGVQDTTDLEIGNQFNSPNNVVCTVEGMGGEGHDKWVGIVFSGASIPTQGTFTRIYGPDDDPDENPGCTELVCISMGTTAMENLTLCTSDLSGIKIGDIYSINSIDYTIRWIDYSTRVVTLSAVADAPIPVAGTYTKTSSESGPDSIVVGTVYADINYKLIGASASPSANNEVGYQLMPSNVAVFCVAKVDYSVGSSILSRIPCKSNKSFLGSQYYINNNQVLPHDGKGFVPAGMSSLNLDSHSKSTGLMNFVYNKTILPINSEVHGYNAVDNLHPCVLKEGTQYAMWFDGSDGTYRRILYATSQDGINWSTPVLVINTGTESHGYNSLYSMDPHVIKDGSIYKMWFTGAESTNSMRIMYTSSSNGVAWEEPQVVIDQDVFNSLAISETMNCASVIKDAGTYKMWLTDKNGALWYTTSSNGVSWNLPTKLGFSCSRPCIIKEDAVYRMISTNSNLPSIRLSKDGLNWSEPIRLPNSLPNICSTTSGQCMIKEGYTYKVWFTGIDSNDIESIHMSILSAFDLNNSALSTIGVYNSLGSVNTAPYSNSQVIIIYEALAEQSGRELLSDHESNFNYENINKVSWSVASSLDEYTTSNNDALYRDAISTIFPWFSTADREISGEGSAVISNNTVEIQNNHNLDNMIVHNLHDYECTDGIKFEGIGDSNAAVMMQSVPCNIEALTNTNIYNTAPLDSKNVEIGSELVSINNRIYNMIGCSLKSFNFASTYKPTRPLGNPIIK